MTVTKIPTWKERMSDSHGYVDSEQRAMVAEIADLRAALSAPAIPTVDRNPAHAAVTPMFLLNAAMCIESPHEVATSRKREVLASLHRVAAELQDQRMAARKSEPVAQPAAQGAVSGHCVKDGCTVRVNGVLQAHTHHGKMISMFGPLATPATVKTAEGL